MIKIMKHSFGKTKNGVEVFNYSLKGEIEAEISSYGATLVSLKVPDKNGNMKDVVLGYDTLSDYESNSKYLGATVGRCCNRIDNGRFVLNDEKFVLSINDNGNHLHGGTEGFDAKVWNAEETDNGVRFSYVSPDGEEGYPGNLNVSVTYSLKDKALIINYSAVCDNDTICNITNHSYFNLGTDILNQKVKINSDYFTENNKQSIATGKILPVENTPMDFREFKQIGQDINSDYYQINFANGFDNNWMIREFDGSLRNAATAYDEETGIRLNIYTDYPGVQFYSGNYLEGSSCGKNRRPIKNRSAFCLECQYFPNAVNCKNFVQPVLRKGEKYCKNIIYKFDNI